MKSIFAARLLGLGAILATSVAWSQPPPEALSPPPPPPAVEVPAPGAPPEVEPPVPEVPTIPPPPPGDAVPQPQVELPEVKDDDSDSRVRFAPTVKLLFLGYNAGGPLEGLVLASSLRAGLRFSITPRSPEPYAFGLGIALELGLEGLGVLPFGPQIFGFGITLKFGPSAVTRGGLFFPFFDFYVLYTAVPSRFGFAQKAGAGLNFNLIALLSKDSGSGGGGGKWGGWSGLGGGSGYGAVAMLVLLSLLMPTVELVWMPPTTWLPYSTLEIRVGAGF